MLVGPMRDGLHDDVSVATSFARRSLLFTGIVMILMGRVAVHGQGGVRGLSTGSLMPRRKRRWRVVMSRHTVLIPRLVLRPLGGALSVATGQVWRLRCATQRVIRVMQSAGADSGAVVASDAERRRSVLDGTVRTVSGPGRIGQRSRTTHLSRRLAVDVGEAFSKSSAAMGQEPNTAGSRARCPKF